jgi:hypothetical protein
MLSNIHSTPSNHNFLDQYGCAIKRHIVEQYNTNKGYCWQKWQNVRQLWHMSSYMEMDEKAVLSLFGSLCTQRVPASQVLWTGLNHKQFRTQLIRKLLQNMDTNTTSVQRGISISSARRLSRLEVQNSITGLSEEPKGGVSCVAWGQSGQPAHTFVGVRRRSLCASVFRGVSHENKHLEECGTIMSDEPL